MFQPADLDPREQEIYDNADAWYATRFIGRGVYDKIGPFPSQLEAIQQIALFFRKEEEFYPPPGSIWSKPFALYAASSKHNDTHVVVGCVYRDGVRRATYHEFQEQRKAERKDARKHRGGGNTDGTS